MLRTLDIVLIVVMTATATVTYSIKHRADLKLEEVQKLEAEIKLQQDTIELLKADWALMKQPNRLEHLVGVYGHELLLQPTDPMQLASPKELPMMKADVPPPPPSMDDKKNGLAEAKSILKIKPDAISTGSVKR